MASNLVSVFSFRIGNAAQSSSSSAIPSRRWYPGDRNGHSRGKTDCPWLSLDHFPSSPSPCTEEDQNISKSGGQSLVCKWTKLVNSPFIHLWLIIRSAWISWLNVSMLLATLSLGLFNASKDDIARKFAYVYAFISVAILVSSLYMR